MDIRVVNQEGELINVSDMSLRAIGDNLVAYNDENKPICVAHFEREEEARGVLDVLIGRVKRNRNGNVFLDVREMKF